eukprot:TRINITY_DN4358_c0_g1_i1.p1 TRINITY_DN4358_c0_g1~~TRINITY_DN4358_c0_g1_i1.p1  ORF type:complete len:447 (+),score=106.13 TRINITY_DN4358_c0_g1_i1:183-1343(+)
MDQMSQQNALDEIKNNPQFQQKFMESLGMTYEPADEGFNELMTEAMERVRDKDIDGAYEVYKKGLDLDYKKEILYSVLGFIELRFKRNVSAASDLFYKSLAINELYAPALNGVALCLIEQGKIEEAFDYAESAVESDESYISGMMTLGKLEMTRNNYDEALELFNIALSLDRENAASYSAIGDVYLAKENLEEAEFHYRKCLKKDPSIIDVRCTLVLTYAYRRNFGELRSQVNKINQTLVLQKSEYEAIRKANVQSVKDMWESLKGISKSLYKEKLYSECISLLNIILEEYPQEKNVMLLKGLSLSNLNKQDEATEVLKQAYTLGYYTTTLTSDPHNITILKFLADIMVSQGKREELIDIITNTAQDRVQLAQTISILMEKMNKFH